MASSFNPMNFPFDAVRIGDPPIESPGLCRVSGVKVIYNWQKVLGPGWSGGFSRFIGQELCEFKLEFELFEDEHWEAWAPFARILAAKPIGKPVSGATKQGAYNAIPIIHPYLLDAGISSAVTQELGQPEKQELGSYIIRAGMLAFRMPKLTLAKVEADAPPKPLDERDRRIADLASQVKARRQAAANNG